jgi:putative drug exporter of the RND superfamily
VIVGVFSIFATLPILAMKEMGIGLATAVLIDASIVRGVLLPASMKLLGDWNWYLAQLAALATEDRAQLAAVSRAGSGRRVSSTRIRRTT